MDVGAFHMGSVAFGGRIVDHEQQPWGQWQFAENQNDQLRCDGFGLAAEGCQEVIIVLVVVADPSGPQPGRHGTASLGEENSDQKQRQTPPVAGMQSGGQPLTPFGPVVRACPTASWIDHPWLSCRALLFANAA